jgi:hypothetical protein
MIALLDIEASSLLRSLSHPVEIAFVASDLSSGYVALIAPAEEWDDRSDEAEAIHGLRVEDLETYGEPVGEVAAALNEMLSGARVMTDAPDIDGRWLRVLFDAAGIAPTFPVFAEAPEEEGDPSRIGDVEALIVAAESLVGEGRVPKLDLLARSVSEGVGLVAHRALDDALFHAVRLAVARFLRGGAEASNSDIRELIDDAIELKFRVVEAAVARRARRGWRDGDALRRILRR